MTTPAKFPNPVPRDQIITGLHQLADYLDTHPTIPVAPYGWELLVGTHSTTDPDGLAEIDRIAAHLGVIPDDQITDGGHYAAIKTFGPITYRAFHIPARSRAIHRAFMTYADSVIPDPDDPPQAA
jgi:hypothetical protein